MSDYSEIRLNYMIKRYQDLSYWQKSMDLVDQIYTLIRQLPENERNCLCDQMQRAAISIPSNIAEGYDRGSRQEYAHFLTIARASKSELETQLFICIRQGYFTKEQVAIALALCEEIGRMLTAAITKLKSN